MEHHHTHWHQGENKKWLLFSIILNVWIVIIEFIWWIVSGSMALLSDAIHNLSDVASLILSFIWEKISKKEKDNHHTFAFKRAEVIIAFINSITLILLWIYIIYESLKRFYLWEQEINSIIMFVIGFIGFLWNFISILILHREKEDNLNKKSAYLHLLYDAVSSVLVVLWGIIIYYTHLTILDVIVSIIISIFVIQSWFWIFKSSLHILMQWVPENIQIQELLSGIRTMKGVQDVHDLHIWSIDSNDYFLSAHIVVDEKSWIDRLIKDINTFLGNTYHIHHTSLQVVENKCC